MACVVVLVHAPVLGPGSWAAVAGELSRARNRVVAGQARSAGSSLRSLP